MVNRKAISTVLGGLIMVVIVTTTIASFFAYQQQFNGQYQSKVQEVNDFNRLAMNERFSITPMVNSTNSLFVNVTNLGAGASNIVAVFVDNQLTNDLILTPVTINDGAVETIDANSVYSGTGSVVIKILSERGNTISTIYPIPTQPGGNNQQGASFVGPIKLEFDTFNYYKVNAPGNKVHDLVLSSATPAYTIDTSSLRGNYIAFSLEITNKDPAKRTIVMDRFTELFDTKVGVSSSTNVWHMANIDTVGNLGPYQNITLTFGNSITLWFVTGSPASDDGSKAFSPGTQVTSFLVFHGTIDGAPWGQNSPFVTSVYK